MKPLVKTSGFLAECPSYCPRRFIGINYYRVFENGIIYNKARISQTSNLGAERRCIILLIIFVN